MTFHLENSRFSGPGEIAAAAVVAFAPPMRPDAPATRFPECALHDHPALATGAGSPPVRVMRSPHKIVAAEAEEVACLPCAPMSVSKILVAATAASRISDLIVLRLLRELVLLKPRTGTQMTTARPNTLLH